jgi:hypothetical protein
VRAVLRDRVPHDWLPVGVRRSLAHAVISRRLEPADVTVPLLETIDGDWVAWQVLVDQLAKFGEAWAVSQITLDRPIAEDRLVFVLPASELETARSRSSMRGIADATVRRIASATWWRGSTSIAGIRDRRGRARRRRSPPRAAWSGARASAVERRGVYAHRALHPFDCERSVRLADAT